MAAENFFWFCKAPGSVGWALAVIECVCDYVIIDPATPYGCDVCTSVQRNELTAVIIRLPASMPASMPASSMQPQSENTTTRRRERMIS